MNQLGRYPSPLRYPGGKGKVANFVKLVMLENDLVGHDYVEPYAGGASVALSLLYEDFADHIHINDINSGVSAFWQSAVHETDDLCALIDSTNVSIDEWQRQREIAFNPKSDGLSLAFATFFLNRTNRSGIIGGGVIGGLDQEGPWKLDARYNKPELIRRIQKIGRHRNRISVTKMDAVDYLQRWQRTGESPALVYLDPPYYVKGEGLYDNFYGPGDHAAVADAVRRLSHEWLVSYDAHPEIMRIYSGLQTIRYSLSYSANSKRSQGAEVMFFSDSLDVPGLTPSGIPNETVARAQVRP
ncbi:DNA adenine methylase [Herbiconiux sp. P17]|uniref:DNA adenine methylase n=1 Tax=Herbiconiux wuyangfengii TaxID=3342794 RepID=UPI0035B6B1A7